MLCLPIDRITRNTAEQAHPATENNTKLGGFEYDDLCNCYDFFKRYGVRVLTKFVGHWVVGEIRNGDRRLRGVRSKFSTFVDKTSRTCYVTSDFGELKLRNNCVL